VEHLLTAPRSPTTTGKVERFHRTLRLEFDTARVLSSIKVAQQALDEWVEYYNQQRPHQSLGDLPPAARFTPKPTVKEPAPGRRQPVREDRTGAHWISRNVGKEGGRAREMVRTRTRALPAHARSFMTRSVILG
jgi:hypothetical protein